MGKDIFPSIRNGVDDSIIRACGEMMMEKTSNAAPTEPYVRPKSSCAGNILGPMEARKADQGAEVGRSEGKDMRVRANKARGGVRKGE